MKKSSILNLAEVLEIQTEAQKQNFENKTLEENMQFLLRLEAVQSILFDRKQSDQNYVSVPIETDLRSISLILRSMIITQFAKISPFSQRLEKNISDYVYIKDINKPSQKFILGNAYRKGVAAEAHISALRDRAKAILDECKEKFKQLSEYTIDSGREESKIKHLQALQVISINHYDSKKIENEVNEILKKSLTENGYKLLNITEKIKSEDVKYGLVKI